MLSPSCHIKRTDKTKVLPENTAHSEHMCTHTNAPHPHIPPKIVWRNKKPNVHILSLPGGKLADMFHMTGSIGLPGLPKT